MEKPPEYDTVVILDPPCYDDAIKLNPANLLHTKYYQDVLLPNYADLEIAGNIDASNCSRTIGNVGADNSRPNDVITTRNATTNNINSNNNNSNHSQTNSENNVTNSYNPSVAITIEQTASDFIVTNESNSTQKSGDNDSVASQSTMS